MTFTFVCYCVVSCSLLETEGMCAYENSGRGKSLKRDWTLDCACQIGQPRILFYQDISECFIQCIAPLWCNCYSGDCVCACACACMFACLYVCVFTEAGLPSGEAKGSDDPLSKAMVYDWPINGINYNEGPNSENVAPCPKFLMAGLSEAFWYDDLTWEPWIMQCNAVTLPCSVSP